MELAGTLKMGERGGSNQRDRGVLHSRGWLTTGNGGRYGSELLT
jgi:hypothetical protein